MQAFIGLGSNLDQPAQRLISALLAMARLPGLTLRHHSRLYSSAPIGPQDQPDYVNAVAQVHSTLAPHVLLHSLQARQSRDRSCRATHRLQQVLKPSL